MTSFYKTNAIYFDGIYCPKNEKLSSTMPVYVFHQKITTSNTYIKKKFIRLVLNGLTQNIKFHYHHHTLCALAYSGLIYIYHSFFILMDFKQRKKNKTKKNIMIQYIHRGTYQKMQCPSDSFKLYPAQK